MVRRNNQALLVVIIIAAIFFIANQGTLPFATTIIDEGISPSPFICPTGEDISCNVRGIMGCTQLQQGNAVVIARTDDFDYSDGWIALSDGFGGLDSWSDARFVTRSNFETSEQIELPFGFTAFKRTGGSGCSNQECLYVRTGENDRFWRYKQVGGANTNPIPQNNCNGVELCSGFVESYNCEGLLRIEQSQSDSTLLTQETLSYSSNQQPGQDVSLQYNIQSGNIVKLTGGDTNEIEFEVLKSVEECVQDRCNADGTGIIECVLGQEAPQPTFCNEGSVCSEISGGVECVDVVGLVSQRLLDSNGQEVEGYPRDTQVNYEFRLFSNEITSATATIKLINSQNQIVETINRNVQLDGRENLVTFSPQSVTGTYFIQTEVTHIQGQNIFDAIDFRIANEISMAIIGTSDDAVATIFSNAPAIIELRVFDENGNPTNADTFITTRLREGTNTQTLQNPPRITQSTGVYRYIYDIPDIQTDSILLVEASAQKLGFSTTENDEFIVKPAFINIEFTNAALLVDLAPGLRTVKFETKNPQQELMSTQNQVEVILPGGQVQQVNSVQGSSGRYEFQFNFQSTGGHFVKVQSSADGFVTSSKQSPGINIISGGGDELQCTENNDCNFGQICSNNQCIEEEPGSSSLLIFIAIGSVVGVVVLVLIITRLSRRRR